MYTLVYFFTDTLYIQRVTVLQGMPSICSVIMLATVIYYSSANDNNDNLFRTHCTVQQQNVLLFAATAKSGARQKEKRLNMS